MPNPLAELKKETMKAPLDKKGHLKLPADGADQLTNISCNLARNVIAIPDGTRHDLRLAYLQSDIGCFTDQYKLFY